MIVLLKGSFNCIAELAGIIIKFETNRTPTNLVATTTHKPVSIMKRISNLSTGIPTTFEKSGSSVILLQLNNSDFLSLTLENRN